MPAQAKYTRPRFSILEEQMRPLTKNRAAERGHATIENLLESGAALLGGGSQSEVFQAVVNGIRRLGLRRVRLYLTEQNGEILRCVAQVGMQEDFEGEQWSTLDDAPMQPSNWGLLQLAMTTCEARSGSGPVMLRSKLSVAPGDGAIFLPPLFGDN
jgi:hypothetical protein